MAAKKKYVPGKALARLNQSKIDTRLVKPEHLIPVRVGLELAFDELMFGKLDRHGWDTMCECFNFAEAVATVVIKEDNPTIKAGQVALKSVNHRKLLRGVWGGNSSEIAAIRAAIKEYHAIVLSITHAEFRTALSYMENNQGV